MQAGQTQAFTISDMSTVWVLANVYQNDLAYVKMGDDVVVQTDAYPDSFHGRISYISAALDPNTRTLQARIVVDNPGEKLKRDMYCTVTVTAGAIQNAIAVPDAAVLRDDENQPFVYVENGSNQFGRRAVEIGESQNGQTQILQGAFGGRKSGGRRQPVSAIREFVAALIVGRAESLGHARRTLHTKRDSSGRKIGGPQNDVVTSCFVEVTEAGKSTRCGNSTR